MRNRETEYQLFEVINVKPLIVKFSVKDENITLMFYLIPNLVRIEKDQVVSVVSSAIFSVFSDKPRFDDMCDPRKFINKTPIIPEITTIDEGGTEIRVNDKKIIKIKAKITNINVYSDLRDNLGNPCVNVSWIQSINVE
ncbi:hypothetical protein GFS03_04135 [Sulfolobus sp. E5-1-F]|uniref:hypothetical protein n=1 Tax=Saccharolobus sp. E5-1-F TaxID=2663019 RepID=UPI001294C3C5|nr:hypothetical protein [Sulfolobus sp. E5-1-F]QGA53829.1 hypothetical protein GFS03_04135 [Sulfolobus sp. E5-1-F]